MDSRDSSSSSVSASRDGSFVDEDGLISLTAGLAKEAALLFQSQRFAECFDILNLILQKKKDDPKVLHNMSVVKYFRDGCSDPRKLLEELNEVKKRIEDLAHAAGEQAEASNAGNSAISGSKGRGAMPAVNCISIGYGDEFDTSVAKLNIAVISFHLHEYGNALSVLDPLYQNIEPIDETTALHICLLLLDIALASNDARKAADVIQYLENSSGVTGQGDSGNTTLHQSSNPPPKSCFGQSNFAAPETSNSDSVASTDSSETPLTRLLSDETEYENLLSTLDIGGQNLTRPFGFSGSNDLSRTSADRSAPAVDLKLKLHLYKVRLLLLTGNLKAAKREVKLALNIARGKDSSSALLLKSQLEYARGNHPKAIKLLMTSSNRTELWMQSIFNNNLGCIYSSLKKHHTSALFVSKALRSSSSLRSEKPLMLSNFSQDKSLLIAYNCGLQNLACGKPITAARCFQKASLVFSNQPLFWLRIAECCLLALEKGLLKSSGDSNAGLKVHIIGRGVCRQLLVENGSSKNSHFELLGSINNLSVSFARQCLHNALHLLDSFESKSLENGSSAVAVEESSEDSSVTSPNNNLPGGDLKANVTSGSSQATSNGDINDSKGGASPNATTIQSSISSYKDICTRNRNMIKQAVLGDLAYVELNLENPLRALSVANSLLKLPECSKVYIFLAHVYAAEALCHLNRPKEASEHLWVYLNGSNSVEVPYSEGDREKWGVNNGEGEELNGVSVAANNLFKEEHQGLVFLRPEEARGSLYVNLSAISAMQGDLEQAHRYATEALFLIPQNPKALVASVYVSLLLGETQDALLKLKRFDGVRFLSTDAQLMKTTS